MHLYTIDTGYFKLDGGAMFGVVPKVLWSKTNPCDDRNLCPWAMRSLLVENGDKLILIDNGIGDKQDDKFLKHYYLHGDVNLRSSLKKYGFFPEDITDVFLTHLHFDHCGGSVVWNKKRSLYEMTFKNARYWSNASHWEWAVNPNNREKASFLKENILPIQESGHLNFVQDTNDIFPDFSALLVNGHTESQMIPHIRHKGKTIVFAADLLPSTGHIPLPYVMGYDTRPLVTLSEKEKFLNNAVDNDYIIFLQHDNYHECCTLKKDSDRVVLDRTFNLSDIL
ncbi:MAG: MBL fold metallo-hydrolase [Flavobacteriales bacterium]|nr:MBL fold metallo-hydrolase [Flavobacteriales bacterium]|tara:strand:- start:14 stop:856 length:843 start_codon:yes stop_codon:yes gene_type:complete